jgi:catalase
MKSLKSIAVIGAVAITSLLLSQTRSWGQSPSPGDKTLAEQIFDTMVQVHGTEAGNRPVHAKGIVCQGTFTPSKDAATLSRASFLHKATSITVRFSDGAPSSTVSDGSPNANPRGMAIRFALPFGKKNDIVAISHNGFIIHTGEEFLALQKAIVATDPSQPHPWPIEVFLSTHPAALKFVQENVSTPVSFATQAFFGNDAFIFINKDGGKQPFRYQILPAEGQQNLGAEEAKAKPANFLFEDIRTRLAKEPIKYRLIAQLPNAGDATADPSVVWPDDRKTVDLGTITIASVLADSDGAQKALAFDPTNLADGIETSDDILPGLRSSVYKLSAEHRMHTQ